MLSSVQGCVKRVCPKKHISMLQTKLFHFFYLLQIVSSKRKTDSNENSNQVQL